MEDIMTTLIEEKKRQIADYKGLLNLANARNDLLQKEIDDLMQLLKYPELFNEWRENRKQKWIPVDERLPEEDGHYLVCNYGFIPWISELKTFMGIRGWCNGANMPVVKMWMPLPKAPEDGEQDD